MNFRRYQDQVTWRQSQVSAGSDRTDLSSSAHIIPDSCVQIHARVESERDAGRPIRQ